LSTIRTNFLPGRRLTAGESRQSDGTGFVCYVSSSIQAPIPVRQPGKSANRAEDDMP
jgi:hypothetical protein